MCKKFFYSSKNEKIKDEYASLAPGEEFFVNKKAHKKASSKYRGRPFFAILFDKRNMDQIIRSFKEVKELDVTFEAVDSPTDAAVAAKQLSDTVSLRYKFGITQKVNDIAQAANQLLSRSGFRRGRAVVVNDFDEERTVDLIKCPQGFGQENFDELAQRVDDLKASDFQKNDIINDLIHTLESKENAPTFAQIDKAS
ncbi:hypothetical protein [Halomonas halodenitrificans]|uniref:hypothetical protein n=1 Tax=Halomonas halodenitrificans TaxID=28252 RepID=UPI0012EB162A|nr:hypothetical protein [Halomonas halodenitrificans]